MNLAIVTYEHLVSKTVAYATMARYNGRAVVILSHFEYGIMVRYCNDATCAFTVSLSELSEF